MDGRINESSGKGFVWFSEFMPRYSETTTFCPRDLSHYQIQLKPYFSMCGHAVSFQRTRIHLKTEGDEWQIVVLCAVSAINTCWLKVHPLHTYQHMTNTHWQHISEIHHRYITAFKPLAAHHLDLLIYITGQKFGIIMFFLLLWDNLSFERRSESAYLFLMEMRSHKGTHLCQGSRVAD